METASREVSAGGVVIADVGDRNYVALVRKLEGGWVLPKGHVRYGESLENAALREVREEAGLSQEQLRVLRYLGSFEFNEHPSDIKAIKKNHFFLMRCVNRDLPQLTTDPQHAFAAWHALPLQDQDMVYGYQKMLIDQLNDLEPGGDGRSDGLRGARRASQVETK